MNDKEIEMKVNFSQQQLLKFQNAVLEVCCDWIGYEPGWEDYIESNSAELLDIAKELFKQTE